MFTKQHYEIIAKILNNRYKIAWLDESYNTGYKEAIEDTMFELADCFAIDNPLFDKSKFLIACGLE